MTTPGNSDNPYQHGPEGSAENSSTPPPGPPAYGQQPPGPPAGQTPPPPAYGQQPQPPQYQAPQYQPPQYQALQPPAASQAWQNPQAGPTDQSSLNVHNVVERFKADSASRPTAVVAGCITLAASAVVFGLWYIITLFAALGSTTGSTALVVFDWFTGGMGTGIITVVVILTLVTMALASVAAWRVWNGSNGWRIAGLVLGILMAVYNLFLLFGGIIVLGLLAFLASGAVIVLWFVTPSNQWFEARKFQTYGGPQPPTQY